MSRLRLPIEIHTFAQMRNDGYAYVNKTAFVSSRTSPPMPAQGKRFAFQDRLSS